MTELHVWTYDSNDGDFYVAESAEEAAQMHREQMGNDPVGDDVTWVAMDDNKIFLFRLDECRSGWVQGLHRKTFRELIAWNGKGYLASVNY